MRIESGNRIAAGANRVGRGPGEAGSFRVEAGQARPAQAVAGMPAASSLDVLLALQAVDSPSERKRRIAKRGRVLLDALDGLRTDLLAGNPGEGRLNQMLAQLGTMRDATEPDLDATLEAIELRVRVELAKRGRFPLG
jgi:hypothetical protein